MENNQKKRRFLSALFFAKEISGVSTGREKNHFLNRLNKLTDAIMKSLAYTSARAIGFAFLSFGLLSLIMNLSKYYFADNPTVELATLIMCAAFVVVGVPLVFIDKPLSIMLQDFIVTDYIFFEFFSIKRMRRDEKIKTIPNIVAIVIGLALATLAFFFSVEYVLISIAVLIFATISFVSPEFPFLFSVLILPYISALPFSDFYLAGLLVLTIVSFFRKVMLGKRVYIFGISDVLIFVFALVIFIFGIVGKGDMAVRENMIYFIFALAYIPAANMIVNRRLVECATDAVLASATPISIFAIVVHIAALANPASGVSYEVFASAEAITAYIFVAAAFALFYIPHLKGGKRALVVIQLMLFLIALLTSMLAPVLIILPPFVLSYVFISRSRSSRVWVLLLFLLPGVIFFLPAGALDAISSAFSMPVAFSEMSEQLLYSFRLFLENMFFGVDYTLDGALYFTNTPIGIGLRFGVLAIIIITIIIFLRLRQLSLYDSYLRSSSLLSLSNMTFLAMVSLLMLGWFADVSANMSIYVLFFLVFGMSTASLRISKSEYEDRLRYFGDNRSVDSSDADITLKR